MTDKEIFQQAKNSVFWKLENTLRGDAFLTKESRSLTEQEKQARMKAVEEFVIYIRNFEDNKRKLTEYEDMINRLINDGR